MIEHTCNAVRLQVSEEFPDLAMYFIVYHQGDAEKALQHKRKELEKHPAGPLLLPALKKASPDQTICLAAQEREKKFLKLLAHKKTLAVLFLLIDESITDADRLRQRVLALAWHALNALEKPETKSVFDKNQILTVRYENEISTAWHNMLADTFSALVFEMQGKKGAIRALANRRSTAALDAQSNHAPEFYPYPVVMDAALLVYNETRKEGLLSKTRPLTQAFEMTGEIGITFDQSTVLQWWAFAKPAQEMAWLNKSKNDILGAAIHASEDPYARSIAYLVAETLTIDPSPLSAITFYNTFADPEINERNYRKASDEIFQVLLPKASLLNRSDPLRVEAAKQNKKLMEGHIMNWCAPALVAAADAFDSQPADDGKNTEAARKAFENTRRKMSGETLAKLGQMLITLRRTLHETGPEHAAAAMREDKYLRSFADTLLIHPETGK